MSTVFCDQRQAEQSCDVLPGAAGGRKRQCTLTAECAKKTGTVQQPPVVNRKCTGTSLLRRLGRVHERSRSCELPTALGGKAAASRRA